MVRGQSFMTSVEALRPLFSFLWMFLTGWGWQPTRDPLRSRHETLLDPSDQVQLPSKE